VAPIGQIQIGRIADLAPQEGQELGGVFDREVDVLDHGLAVPAENRSSARVSPSRPFNRMSLVYVREFSAAAVQPADQRPCAPRWREHQNQSVSQRHR